VFDNLHGDTFYADAGYSVLRNVMELLSVVLMDHSSLCTIAVLSWTINIVLLFRIIRPAALVSIQILMVMRLARQVPALTNVMVG